MLTDFCDMKGQITIDFLKNFATENIAYYCQLFDQNASYSLKDSPLCKHDPTLVIT